MYRLLALLNDFIKGINSSTPTAFFTHETFALLVVDVPINDSTVISFTANFTHKETRVFEQEHRSSNGRFFNIELATHSRPLLPTRSITVTVPLLEMEVNGYSSSPIQRFSFSLFVKNKLFMPSNTETNERTSSAIVGIMMKDTHTASSIEPIIITFVIPNFEVN